VAVLVPTRKVKGIRVLGGCSGTWQKKKRGSGFLLDKNLPGTPGGRGGGGICRIAVFDQWGGFSGEVHFSIAELKRYTEEGGHHNWLVVLQKGNDRGAIMTSWGRVDAD